VGALRDPAQRRCGGIRRTDTFTTKYPEAFVDAAASDVPLGRVGEPEQIAWLVAYLASPAGDHTTGTVLTVDGGRDNHLGRGRRTASHWSR